MKKAGLKETIPTIPEKERAQRPFIQKELLNFIFHVNLLFLVMGIKDSRYKILYNLTPRPSNKKIASNSN